MPFAVICPAKLWLCPGSGFEFVVEESEKRCMGENSPPTFSNVRPVLHVIVSLTSVFPRRHHTFVPAAS
jgi:hypothetical protein